MNAQAVRDHGEGRHGVVQTKGASDDEEEHRDPPTWMPLRCDLRVRKRVHLLAVVSKDAPRPIGRGAFCPPFAIAYR